MSKRLKTVPLDQVIDKHIGKRGTPDRERFERELELELIGEAIREARLQRDLTQEQLGKLVGVQKAQISKLENNTGNVTIDTILRVFNALQAKVRFSVELSDRKFKVA
jgi:HTH-type transcriptional regulator/antitoxin HipB